MIALVGALAGALPSETGPAITESATWVQVLVLALILAGAVLCLTAAIGLLRFRDVPSRLHAATKPQVLGLLLICIAIGLSLQAWPVVGFLIPIVLIQLVTAPLSAHMVGRQAYRNGTLDAATLVVDELATSPDVPEPEESPPQNG